MTIRFQHGADSLVSPGNTLLHGASTASISCWAQVNAVNATTNTINLFTKQFNQSVQLVRPSSFSNKIRLQWLGVNGSPSSDNTLTLGQAYHLAWVWTSGAQQFYVDGTLVGTASIAGTLATQASNRFFRLGHGTSAQDDLDFDLDDMAVWVGYALTQTDVTNLLNRTNLPTDISASNLVWFVSLTGAGGGTPTVGDPGLANQGTAGSGQNISTVSGSPVYVAGKLSYTPPTQVLTAAVGPSGKTACFVFADLSNNATNISAVNSSPTVSLNGGAAQQLSNPVWGVAGTTSLPYVLYPLPFTAAGTDSVTFTAPANWVTAAAGNLAAATNAPLTNLVGGSLLPTFTPGTKTMGVGYNLQRLRYYLPTPVYANAFKMAGPWTKNFGTFTLNADGTLATMTGTCYAVVSLCDVGGVPGYPAQPAGVWTLVYDGNGTATLGEVGSYPTGSVTLLSNGYNGGTNNTSTYNVTRVAGSYFVAVQVNVTSLGTTGVTNIRVYPPGVATDGSQKWHPNFLTMLKGVKCIRFMEAIETNASTIVNYSDFMPASQATYGTARSGTTISLTQVSVPATNPWETNRTAVQLTTATAHGLADGQLVTFSADCPNYTTSGAPQTLALYQLPVHVIDATNFSVGRSGAAATVSGTQSYSGSISYAPPPGMPLADIVDLCNTIGADLWFNCPHAATDACLTSAFNYIAANLSTLHKCYVEYSNELWNSSFPQFEWAYGAAQLDGTLPGTTYTRQHQWIAKEAAHVHALAVTAFTAAGRPSTDVRRVLGSQFGSASGLLTDALAYGAAQGYPYDLVAVAPYWEDATNNSTWQTTYGSLLSGWTPEQLHDLTQLWLQYGTVQTWLTAHLNAIAAQSGAYPNLKLCCYEGGPQAVAGVSAALSQEWGRHPRIPASYLYLWQKFNDSGAAVWNHFDLGDTLGQTYQAADSNWPAYYRWNMPAGTGDGSDGWPDNRQNYSNLDNLVSVIGHAANVWNQVSDPTPPVVPGASSTQVIVKQRLAPCDAATYTLLVGSDGFFAESKPFVFLFADELAKLGTGFLLTGNPLIQVAPDGALVIGDPVLDQTAKAAQVVIGATAPAAATRSYRLDCWCAATNGQVTCDVIIRGSLLVEVVR